MLSILAAQIFALVFIHFFQLNEILAFTAPVVAAFYSNAPLNSLDWVAAGFYLLLVAGEAIADYQVRRSEGCQTLRTSLACHLSFHFFLSL